MNLEYKTYSELEQEPYFLKQLNSLNIFQYIDLFEDLDDLFIVLV
jgi:hypothetical protein